MESRGCCNRKVTSWGENNVSLRMSDLYCLSLSSLFFMSLNLGHCDGSCSQLCLCFPTSVLILMLVSISLIIQIVQSWASEADTGSQSFYIHLAFSLDRNSSNSPVPQQSLTYHLEILKTLKPRFSVFGVLLHFIKLWNIVWSKDIYSFYLLYLVQIFTCFTIEIFIWFCDPENILYPSVLDKNCRPAY